MGFGVFAIWVFWSELGGRWRYYWFVFAAILNDVRQCGSDVRREKSGAIFQACFSLFIKQFRSMLLTGLNHFNFF